MRHRSSLLGAVLAITLVPLVALASSHREAPAIALDPAADNTDLWAWLKPGTRDRLYIVAAYNPLEEPSGGPNFHKFSDDVLYEVHLVRGTSSLADVITYQVQFKTEPFTRVDVTDLTKGPGGGKEFFAQLSGSVGYQKQTYTVTKVQGGHSTVIAQDVLVAPPNPARAPSASSRRSGFINTPQSCVQRRLHPGVREADGQRRRRRAPCSPARAMTASTSTWAASSTWPIYAPRAPRRTASPATTATPSPSTSRSAR